MNLADHFTGGLVGSFPRTGGARRATVTIFIRKERVKSIGEISGISR